MSLLEAAAATPPLPPAPPVTTTEPPPGGPGPPTLSPSGGAPQPQAESPPAVIAPPPAAASYDPVKFGEADPKTGRPANVPSKYWDYDRREVKWDAVLTQEQWLQKKLGEKREKPPGSYELQADADFTPPEGLDKDPVYKDLASFAREELELSQGQWNGLIRRYMNSMSKSGGEIEAAEIASLGPDGMERIGNLGKILAANFPPEVYEDAKAGIVNAAGARLVEALVKAQLPASLESGGATDSGDSPESLDALQFAKDEFGQPKMADPKYAEAVRRRRAAYLRLHPNG